MLYNFYDKKSEKLVVMSISIDITAAFYSIFISNSVATFKQVIIMFASKKSKIVINVWNWKFLLIIYLLLSPLYYNFYKQKCKRLVVALVSTSNLAVNILAINIIAIFYSISIFKPAIIIFISNKIIKTAKDVLIKKSLLLINLLLAHIVLLLNYNFYNQKIENWYTYLFL